jgi:hypothetical protein
MHGRQPMPNAVFAISSARPRSRRRSTPEDLREVIAPYHHAVADVSGASTALSPNSWPTAFWCIDLFLNFLSDVKQSDTFDSSKNLLH